jgi:hypothetical protein
MEKSKSRSINGLAAIILALIYLSSRLDADTPPSPAPAAPLPASAPQQPQGDPFIKKDAPAQPEETGPISNLLITVEVYKLSQTEGVGLIQGNASDEARHDRVLDLVKNGKARLETVMCGATRSGDQVAVEQVNVLSFASSFIGVSGKDVVANLYKQRNIGFRLIVKGQTNPDKTGYFANMFLEASTLRGFSSESAPLGGPAAPYPVSLAEFDAQRVNAVPPFFPFEKIRFLGTYSPVPPESLSPPTPQPANKVEDAAMILVFGKVSQIHLNPGATAGSNPVSFEQQFSLYSMDREKAREILNQKQEMNSAYQAVQSLVKTNQAKLEHLSVLRTNTGIKSNFDEVAEVTYPTFASAEFESQDVGYSGEVKTDFIGRTSLVSIDLTKSQLMNYLENLPTEGVAPSYHQSTPLFELRSIVTRLNSGLGEHELLGTISPAGDNGVPGQKDTGQVWMEFLQTTAVNP